MSDTTVYKSSKMKSTFILLYLFFVSFFCFSQGGVLFDGPYEFKGKLGQATFEYDEGADGDRILNGFFSFDRKEIDSLDRTLLTKFQVRGSYEDNQKTGDWTYDQERHKVILDDVIDFKLIAQLESEDLEIKATYQRGLPHGEWQLVKNIFKDNEKDIRAKAEDIRFDSGVMIGNVSYRNFLHGYTQFIRGRLTSRGLMQGEWSLVYVEDSTLVSEVRNYEDGFLLGVVRRDLESGQIIDEAVFYATIRKLAEINDGKNDGFLIADRTFEPYYNDGFRPMSKERQIQRSGNRFLRDFILDLMRYDDSVDDGGEIVRFPFYTSRFQYDLSEEEERLLVEIPTLFDQISDSVRRFKEMNSLALNRSKSDSLAFAHAYFGKTSGKLAEMEYLVDLLKTGEVRYYDLGNYAEGGLGFLTAEDSITYIYQDDTLRKVIPREFYLDSPSEVLSTLKASLEEEFVTVNRIGDFVERELYEIEVNSKLVALEALILNRKAEMDTLFMNHVSAASSNQRDFAESFVDQFLERVYVSLSEEYASAIEFETKVDRGNVILDLFDELEKRYPSISILFERDEALDEAYMEEMFNPFTYTRYDVRAKERLFEAYRFLYNHYRESMLTEFDYTQIKDYITKIENLQDRMLELRSQDTRSIERRLGRRHTASRIESALDL